MSKQKKLESNDLLDLLELESGNGVPELEIEDEDVCFDLNYFGLIDDTIDKLIMGIIKAYPAQDSRKETDRDRRKRLTAVKKALFSEDAIYGNANNDDVEALRYIADQYIQDRGGQGIYRSKNVGWYPKQAKGARSLATLAEEALDLGLAEYTGTKESAVRRLVSQKFLNNRIIEKDGKETAVSEKDTQLVLATIDDYIPQTVQNQVLQKIAIELKKVGIAIQLDEDNT